MHTNHRHYTLLFFALGAVVVSLVSYFFLYRSIASQSIAAQENLKVLAFEDKKKQEAGDSASLYAKTAEDRARLDAAVLSQGKVVSFITAIEKIGTDTGTELELTSISDETIAGDARFGYFKGHVVAKGSWPNVMRALSLIENMPYSISFDTMRVTESADRTAASRDRKFVVKPWEMTLDVRVLTTKE